MSSHLPQLRSELLDLNRMMFSLWAQRKKRVSEIQQLKNINLRLKEFAHFDPDREWQLIQSLSRQIHQLSMKEVWAFSLLIEEHAGGGTYYPEWSRGIHLQEFNGTMEQMINPLLLKKVHPQLFSALPLNQTFQFLAEFIDS